MVQAVDQWPSGPHIITPIHTEVHAAPNSQLVEEAGFLGADTVQQGQGEPSAGHVLTTWLMMLHVSAAPSGPDQHTHRSPGLCFMSQTGLGGEPVPAGC